MPQLREERFVQQPGVGTVRIRNGRSYVMPRHKRRTQANEYCAACFGFAVIRKSGMKVWLTPCTCVQRREYAFA